MFRIVTDNEKSKTNFFYKLVKRYVELPVQGKAALWLVFCNVLVKGISFITIPIFTRILPTTEYGDLTVYLSSTEVLLILTGWDISYGAYQRGLYRFNDEASFTKLTQVFTTVCTIVTFVILVLLYPIIGDWLAVPLPLYPFMFLYLVTQPSYRNWMAKRQKHYDYKAVTVVSLIFTITVTIIPLVAVILIGKTANVKYTFQMIVSFAFFSVFFLRSINIFSIKTNRIEIREQLKYILTFQFPCLLHSLSLLLLSNADRIMIRSLIGRHEAALYGTVYSFGVLLIVVQSALDQAMIPWRYELLEKKEYATVSKITNMLIVLVGIAVLLFALVAPELLKIFLPVEYYDAIDCMPPIAFSVFFIFLYSVFASIETYFEYTRLIMLISIFCSALNIVLNYFGLKYYDYKVCAYTTLLSYIFFCVGHFWGMRWLCKKRIKHKVFNTYFITFFSLFMLIVMFCVLLLYKHLWIRYVLFIGIIGIVILKNKEIRAMIQH